VRLAGHLPDGERGISVRLNCLVGVDTCVCVSVNTLIKSAASCAVRLLDTITSQYYTDSQYYSTNTVFTVYQSHVHVCKLFIRCKMLSNSALDTTVALVVVFTT